MRSEIKFKQLNRDCLAEEAKEKKKKKKSF